MKDGIDVLVYAELNEKKEIEPVSLECLGAGRRLADESGGRVAVLAAGSGIGSAAEELARYPVDDVYVADSPGLTHYHPELYQRVLKNLYAATKPGTIMFGNTLVALDLAPRIAFDLGAGLVTDCIAVALDGGRPVFSKPVYSGNVIAEYGITTEPAVVTLRARTQEKADRRESGSGRIRPVPGTIDENHVILRVIERSVSEDEGSRLDEADIIVAGGRGVGSREGFTLLSELAKSVGGAVGASRPPCDLGWVPSNAQIGQTGEIVRPSLYIAVGISGSTQHIVGMSGSRTIVAINRDSRAPIFEIADYGIVGNYEEIVPAFSNAINAL